MTPLTALSYSLSLCHLAEDTRKSTTRLPTASFLRCSPTPAWTNPNTHHHTTIGTPLHLKITVVLLGDWSYCNTFSPSIFLPKVHDKVESIDNCTGGFFPIQYSSVVLSRHLFLPCIYCIFSLISHCHIVCTLCTPVYHYTALCCTMILKKQHFLPVFIRGMIWRIFVSDKW